MISLPGLLVLLIVGFFLLRAIPAMVWKVMLGILGAMAACELIVTLAVVMCLLPGWNHDCRIDIGQQADYLWADERSPSEPPTSPVDSKQSEIRPIDLSDVRQSTAEYATQRAEIERQWHDAELERRLWHAGSLAGGLFAWLAIATAYLRLDVHSSGRHRTRLRLAAAGALALTTAAAAWAWTQPL